MSKSLRPHELKHAQLPCPSLSPGVCSNSCPSSQWYCLTISSSIIPFSSCPQSYSESRSFPMSSLFTSGSQSIGASASVSVLPMSIQGWFPLGWTGLISLQSKGLLRVFKLMIIPYFYGGGLVAKLCPTVATPWALACRLLYPWDSPGKNTGVGCHFLLQGIFPSRVSCTAGRFFTKWATREALFLWACT